MKLFEDLMDKSAKLADKAAKVASEAFEQTKVVAGEAMDKGKKKVNELELKNDLSKAQRQLGELYYVLRKTGESNDRLLTQYFNAVAEIEAKLEAAKLEEVNENENYAVVEPSEKTAESDSEIEQLKEEIEEIVAEVKEDFAGVIEELKDVFDGEDSPVEKAEEVEEVIELTLKVCPSCGKPADDNDLFCRECGSKLE